MDARADEFVAQPCKDFCVHLSGGSDWRYEIRENPVEVRFGHRSLSVATIAFIFPPYPAKLAGREIRGDAER